MIVEISLWANVLGVSDISSYPIKGVVVDEEDVPRKVVTVAVDEVVDEVVDDEM